MFSFLWIALSFLMLLLLKTMRVSEERIAVRILSGFAAVLLKETFYCGRIYGVIRIGAAPGLIFSCFTYHPLQLQAARQSEIEESWCLITAALFVISIMG